MINIIRNFLLHPTKTGFFRYSFFAYLTAIIISFFLLTAANLVSAYFMGEDISGQTDSLSALSYRNIFGTIVFAPVIETLLLAAMLKGLSTLPLPPTAASIFAAIFWAGVHGAVDVLWFFGVVWSFFVFSNAYILWRKISFKHAFFAAPIPHMLVNSTIILALNIIAGRFQILNVE